MLFFIPRDTRNYFDQGCHCTGGIQKGEKQFAFDEFGDTLLNLHQLTKEQLDLEISGQSQAITPSSLCNKWKNPPSLYMYRGLPVCKQTFCFIHSVGEKRLPVLKNHLNVEYVNERLHGNTKRVPVNATMYEQTEKLKSFIKNYANVKCCQYSRQSSWK